MDSAADGWWGWEDTCALLTTSLQRNGLFNWGEIRDVVGEEAYGDMQWTRGKNHVWVVRHGDIAPKPRRSLLDYAHTVGAGLHGTGTSRHVVIEEPASGDSRPDMPEIEPTCRMVKMGVRDYELSHYATRETINAAGVGFVRDLMVSFRDRIVRDMEREIQSQIGGASDDDFAFVDGSEKKGKNVAKVTIQDPLEAEKITNAGIRVVRKNPQIPFPHGLVCMISPEQATQLFGSSSVRMERMSAYGIDLVTSPAVKFSRNYDRYMNAVVAQRSLRAAISRIEVDTMRQKAGTLIRARYSMGASVEPRMAARIYSYRK